MSKVIVVGSSNTDLVFETPKFPAEGETVIGGDFEVISGGKGANQAVAAARAGADVLFLTKVGDDEFGSNAIAVYTKEGINTSFIEKQKGVASGTAMIMVNQNSGENAIIVAPGANNHLNEQNIDQITDQITATTTVLCQLEVSLNTVDYLLTQAKHKKALTILNPAPYQEISLELLKKVDIITPNETETLGLTGIELVDKQSIERAAFSLLQMVNKAVIITLGNKGVYFISHEQKGKFIPTSKVKAVDTTAAGDVFNGYFAAALQDNELETAIELGMKSATLSVTRKGAQPSIPFRNEID
ncbi:MAG: ribokinase [Flavobacteriaceae bacterium]